MPGLHVPKVDAEAGGHELRLPVKSGHPEADKSSSGFESGWVSLGIHV
jgi:hypothetical protein